MRQQGETCPALRASAKGHSRCSPSRSSEEAIYERTVEHAIGADFRGFFVVLTDDGRTQLGRVSRAAAVRSSTGYGTRFSNRLGPLFRTRTSAAFIDTKG